MWLGARLSRFGRRRNVVIRAEVRGDDDRALLGRTRIVFNRSLRGECTARALEAAAAGALLFQEAGNGELPAALADRKECVLYTDDNLEALLTYYLEHKEERRALAEAGRTRACACTFEGLWDAIVARIATEWRPWSAERGSGRHRPEMTRSPVHDRQERGAAPARLPGLGR